MAVRPPAAIESAVDDLYADSVAWYWDRLHEPAEFPWIGCRWEPVKIGPTWQTTEDGFWVLPEATIGWQMLGWCSSRMQHKQGVPWRFTLEQARWYLWWGAVDERGSFIAHDAILQRLKGWGKDPIGATWAGVEMLGPCRVAGMDGDTPVATDVPEAWVQLAAVALEQTKNTMRLFPGLFTREAKAEYDLRIGKESVHALGGQRLIQAVTSSPTTLEGARATAVLLNETQHWLANNDGHEMAAVIERNATKSPDGAARTLRITNAYEPSEDSVAQRDREAWETSTSGGSLTTGILYDSLEAPADAPLTAEAAPEVTGAIRGDSIWLDVARIVKSILDTRNPPSRSRRFWYNQIVADEDAWVSPQRFETLADKSKTILPSDRVVLFFDGSKSDDTTGLVGCRVDDGHVFVLGVWQKPPGERGKTWIVDRLAVDQRVREVFDTHKVVAFFADPSHVLDDESTDRFWDSIIDGWHQAYRHRLKLVWAVGAPKSKTGHSIMWDMTDPKRSAEFTAAAELCASEIDDEHAVGLEFTHDGDGRLVRHVRNAKRYPNRWGVSLWKGHRESPRKVDLAVCMVGARMLRRKYLLADPSTRSRRMW